MIDAASPKTRKKPINMMIDADLHTRVKHYCIDNGVTVTQLVTDCLKKKLEEDGGEKSDGDKRTRR